MKTEYDIFIDKNLDYDDPNLTDKDFEDVYDIKSLIEVLNGNFKGIKIEKWKYFINNSNLLNTTDNKGIFEEYTDEYKMPKTVDEFIKLIEDNKWDDHQYPEAIFIKDNYAFICYGS